MVLFPEEISFVFLFLLNPFKHDMPLNVTSHRPAMQTQYHKTENSLTFIDTASKFCLPWKEPQNSGQLRR